jgi:DNA-binding cell septation regulator SpoVG
MKISNHKFLNKGPALAVFDLTISKWGDFQIRNITLMESNKHRWLSMPNKMYVDQTGKKKYYSFVRFENSQVNIKFHEAILKAYDEFVKTLDVQDVKPLDISNDLPF